jgi:hypothetical protein
MTCLFLRFSRTKRYKEKDWRVTHAAFLEQWDQRAQYQLEVWNGPMHRASEYNNYLNYFRQQTRVELRPHRDDRPIEELPDSDDEELADEYDTMTREGTQPDRAPFEHYLVRLHGTPSHFSVYKRCTIWTSLYSLE